MAADNRQEQIDQTIIMGANAAPNLGEDHELYQALVEHYAIRETAIAQAAGGTVSHAAIVRQAMEMMTSMQREKKDV